ncbi:TPA: hypothetical protein ACW9O7_004785, partial [Yersinia enterocolitica]
MDITKSREEFEAWLKSKMPTTYRLAFECGDDDELTNLAKASVLDMRTAWQASRESIQIIPSVPSYVFKGKTNDYRDGFVLGGYQRDANWKEALRTAGIR